MKLSAATKARIAEAWKKAEAKVATPAPPPPPPPEPDLIDQYSTFDFKPVSRLPRPEQRLARAVIAEVKKQMDLEVDPDQFATVGKPKFTVEMAHLPNGELVGGKVDVWQAGVEIFDVTPEQQSSHYDTMTDAKRVGARDTDVAWSGEAKFDADGKLLDVDPALSWSGY